MSNIFQQNALNTTIFKLQVILLIVKVKSQKVTITDLAIGIGFQVTHRVVAIAKVVA